MPLIKKLFDLCWRLRAIYVFFLRLVGLSAAALWRSLMFRTTFIAITGSVGKTTCKECIAVVLASRFPVAASKLRNHYKGIVKTLLSVRPWHRFAVVEIGLDRPGQMQWFARVVRPDIAVWLGVARTHTNRMRSLEQIAKEKSKLVQSLPQGGIAILNTGDEYVSQFSPPDGVRVIRFGVSGGVDLRATDITSIWPDRLAFRLVSQAGVFPVQTRLVGTHWVPSVLAGFAAAQVCGVSLPDAAAAIAGVEPVNARLAPVTTASGAVILRDEFNGSVDTLGPALRVMEEAKGFRKILVITDVSDDKRKLRRRFADFGCKAAQIFDVAVFIGVHADQPAKSAIEAGMPPENVHRFTLLEEAGAFFRTGLKQGDLVLLRGRNTDHLSRLALAVSRGVKCWIPTCSRRELCDYCPDLERERSGGRLARLLHRAWPD